MKNMFNSFFKLSIFSSIILIILGLFLFVKPLTTLSTISYVIGGIILFFGVFNILRYIKDEVQNRFFSLLAGILSCMAGLVIVFNPIAIVSIVPVVFGIWIVINSSFKIQQSFMFKKHGSKKWIVSLVFSFITLICGIVLLFNPFEALKDLTKIIGLFIMIYATIDLVQDFLLKEPATETTITVYNEKK